MNDRIEKLLQFLKDDPNDAFTLYALATEYKKENQALALGYFEQLLQQHERYVGTYYHAAALYVQMGKEKEAQATYQKGMLIARQEGNQHAFAELQSAYNKFMGLDYEDEV